jgi:hypothetical protein
VKKDLIVCDLDGTLCDASHRVHHVATRPKNWDAFYEGVREDDIHGHIDTLLSALVFEPLSKWGPGMDIVFCSGRPERCREDTQAWLTAFGYGGFTVLMRKDGDFRPDYIVKQELLDAHIDKDRVLFVLDDRDQVVDMWRRNGLVCLQVAKGDF